MSDPGRVAAERQAQQARMNAVGQQRRGAISRFVQGLDGFNPFQRTPGEATRGQRPVARTPNLGKDYGYQERLAAQKAANSRIPGGSTGARPPSRPVPGAPPPRGPIGVAPTPATAAQASPRAPIAPRAATQQLVPPGATSSGHRADTAGPRRAAPGQVTPGVMPPASAPNPAAGRNPVAAAFSRQTRLLGPEGETGAGAALAGGVAGVNGTGLSRAFTKGGPVTDQVPAAFGSPALASTMSGTMEYAMPPQGAGGPIDYSTQLSSVGANGALGYGDNPVSRAVSAALPAEAYKQLGDLQEVWGQSKGVDPGVAFSGGTGDLSKPGVDLSNLEEQRRAAFMGGPDSMGGMAAVKKLYAEKLGLDTTNPNVYSMRDLEGRVEALRNQGRSGEQNTPRGPADGFDFSAGADQPMANTPPPDKAQFNVGTDTQMPQKINDYMQSDQFKASLTRPTDEQMLGSALNYKASGTPDANTMASYAALGQERPVTPGEAEMFGRVFGSNDGRSKPGNTVPLGFRDVATLPPLNSSGQNIVLPEDDRYQQMFRSTAPGRPFQL
jgi:hypothetical protein